MTQQLASHEAAFTAKDFLFADGRRTDMRLAYRRLGKLAPSKDNAILLLHGTVGSGLQFLQPTFANALFDAGEALDVRAHFIILPDAIGHGKSGKPSDGLGQHFPAYDYNDIVEAQYRLVTEELGLSRLRLVMGTSMGGMQSWMWGERYPDMMVAPIPVASLPERVTGRNLLWRRLLQVARLEEPGQARTSRRGLGLAWVLFQIMAGSPARLAESRESPEQADSQIRSVAEEAIARESLFDVIWEFEASRDYDPAPHLGRIRAPLLAVNFADDAINPAELGVMDRMIAQVHDGRSDLLSDMRGLLPDMTEDRILTLKDEPLLLSPYDEAPSGLTTCKLVTNALKCGRGRIEVPILRDANGLEIAVSDEGDGFPADFDPTVRRGIGMRMVGLLAKAPDGEAILVDRSVLLEESLSGQNLEGLARPDC